MHRIPGPVPGNQPHQYRIGRDIGQPLPDQCAHQTAHLQTDQQHPAQGMQLTETGHAWAAQMGLSLPRTSSARFAYPCMDWSERRDHLAGALSRALLEHYLARHWFTTGAESRALKLTPKGERELLPLLADTP